MQQEDRLYYELRHAEERRLASEAESVEARFIHTKLAQLYA